MKTRREKIGAVFREYPRMFELLAFGVLISLAVVFDSIYPFVGIFVYLFGTILYDIIRFHRVSRRDPQQARDRLGDSSNFGFGYPLLMFLIGLGSGMVITATTNLSVWVLVPILVLLCLIIPSVASALIMVSVVEYYTDREEQVVG